MWWRWVGEEKEEEEEERERGRAGNRVQLLS
jgi:hypothetical protein